MANLWLADTLNRGMYEPIIRDNLRIINQIAWNNQTNWVNLKFDDSWAVCKSPNVENPCFTVSPGHNFQLASLLLRTKAWDFISDSDKSAYYKRGIEILDVTLKKPIFAENNLDNGFYSLVNPLTNKILDDRKTWWQHCEALIALSLSDGKYTTELNQLEHFFFNTFPDFKNKGEFFYVDKNNNPITSELKGSIGKSAYHTIEMIRFLDENKSVNEIK
jgi:mannose/cellobiose epimerase-like protein (N-acyl-D-glucosamine 2-epimerase family)